MARQAPKHLKKEGKAFWKKVLNEYEFEKEHDFKRLEFCGELLDTIDISRKEIKEKGSFYTDRFGQPKPHPAYALIKDSMITLVRILRELGLDLEPPVDTPRPPKLY